MMVDRGEGGKEEGGIDTLPCLAKKIRVVYMEKKFGVCSGSRELEYATRQSALLMKALRCAPGTSYARGVHRFRGPRGWPTRPPADEWSRRRGDNHRRSRPPGWVAWLPAVAAERPHWERGVAMAFAVAIVAAAPADVAETAWDVEGAATPRVRCEAKGAVAEEAAVGPRGPGWWAAAAAAKR